MKKIWVQVLCALLVVILVVASALTAKFLTKKCVEGTYSCVDSSIAHCVENVWQKTACEYGCLEDPVRCKEPPTDEFIVQPAEQLPEQELPPENETSLGESAPNITEEQPLAEQRGPEGPIRYTQKLQFHRNGVLTYTQHPNLASTADVYFTMKNDLGALYTYTLEFSPGIAYAREEDLEGWTFNLQGKTVTVLTAALRPDTKVKSISLQGDTLLLELNETNVRVNAETVPGASARIISDGNYLQSIVIEFRPYYDVYLDQTRSYLDPVLGQFKLFFKEFKRIQPEKVTMTAHEREGTISFKNYDGVALDLPLFSDGKRMYLGEGGNLRDLIYLEGDTCFFEDKSAEQDCQRAQFLVIDEGKAKILQTTAFSFGTQKMNIQHVTYPTSFAGESMSYPFVEGKPTIINVTGLSKPIVLTLSRKGMTYTKLGSGKSSRINLTGKGYIELINTYNTTPFEGFVFGEYSTPGDRLPSSKLSDVTVVPISEVTGIVYTLQDLNLKGEGFGFVSANEIISSLKHFMTNKGTLYIYDEDAKDAVTIEYPPYAAYATIVLKQGNREYPVSKKNDFFLGKSLGDYPPLTADEASALLAPGTAVKE